MSLRDVVADGDHQGAGRTLRGLAVPLVFVTLVGSVLVPARLTWRIIGELHAIAARDPRVAAAIDQIRGLEERSLVVNAVLVVVALATMVSVIALTRRERRLAVIVKRRLAQESALREAAEALAEAFTIEEVTQQIARTAIQASVARGAFVEHIVPETSASPALAVVQATAGRGVPAIGTSRPYARSHAANAIARGEPILVSDFSLSAHDAGDTDTSRMLSAIVVPLAHSAAPIGALFLVNSERRDWRQGDGLAGAYTFGKLAALAYEKVRLLEEAREGRMQLERAMTSRSRLMRGYSHDVKNPLGAANGYTELLRLGIYGELTTDQHTTIGHIQRCINTALALIQDLDQLGRAETGNIVIEKTTVELANLARTLAEDYVGAAAAKGLSLNVDIPSSEFLIQTDGVRVREIMGNLLTNAIKYTAHGSVQLRVRLAHAGNGTDEKDTQWARIDVDDTGPGIPADKHDVIFEEFSRLGTETSGAGLGLAISSLLAQALGGRISLASEIGRGSTFSLWLPAQLPVYDNTEKLVPTSAHVS